MITLWLIGLWLLALLLAPLPAHAAPAAQTAPVTDGDCAAVTPETLRDELNAISQRIFAEDAALLDLERLVARQWTALEMDAAIDQAVTAAVAQARADTGLWTRLGSSVNPAQAEELTRQVADRAFAAPAFNAAVEGLTAAIAVELADTVARLSAESATQATLCLQGYISERYSAALVATYTRELQAQTAALTLGTDAGMDQGILAVLDRHKTALGGAGVIIAAQIARRIAIRLGETVAKRVAGRIVGRVVGRAGSTLIPVAGWVIGLGLIAYDVWESWDGALPQIEQGLQAAEVKAAIRGEITAVVADELRVETPLIAREVANDLYATWLDFQRQYVQMLDWADRDPAFRDLLAAAEDPLQVAALVDVTLAALGSDGLRAALADGSLARALTLPPVAFTILRATASFPTLFAWAELAGADLSQVVDSELYKHKSPADLSRADLLALLQVGDPAALAALALVDAASLTTLLTLATDHLTALAAVLPAADLSWLGGYLATLSQAQANQVVALLLADSTLLTTLQTPRVQALIADGQDAGAVARFVAAPLTPLGIGQDLLRLASGQVGIPLFAAKYGWWVVGLLGLVLLALAWSLLRWLLSPLLALGRAVGWVAQRPQAGRK
jgi:hypothetical protein